MKIINLPRISTIAIAVAVLSCTAHLASAQQVNGLLKCLVYTSEETRTIQGRVLNSGTGKVGYATRTEKSYGLLVIGPRKIQKASYYDYNAMAQSQVDVKVADILNYSLIREQGLSYAYSRPETYIVGVLNDGSTAKPDKDALLVAGWYSPNALYQLSTSVPGFAVQGRAKLASPYPGISPIWHAPILRSESLLTETALSSQPLGFARSGTDDRMNLVDAARHNSVTTYRFDKTLSEMVKSASSVAQAKTTIDRWLKSKPGGGYQVSQ